MAYLRLFVAEFKRGLMGYIRYPVKAVFEILGVMLFFWAVSSGSVLIEGFGGTEPQGFLEERLIALITLFVSLAGVQVANKVVREEADAGTLEQLCLSPLGLAGIITIRGLADSLRLIPPLAVAGVGLLIIGRAGIDIKPLAALAGLPVVILMNFGMIGLGFMVGAVALVFKRVGFLANLASLALLPFAFTPAEYIRGRIAGLWSVIPLTRSIDLLQYLSLEPDPELGIIVSALGGLGLVSAVWLVVGLGLFRYAEDFARDRGLLGRY